MAVDAPSLEFHLFGQATVRVAGRPVKFAKRATTLAMLAYLVLHRERPTAREFLAFQLFPDADEATALSELRRYLYLAQKALPPSGEPWVLADAETVQWNPNAAIRLDVVEFERLAAEPETQASAIDLYAGDLLEDVYDDWIVAERERLRGRYLAILAQSIARHRAARNFPAAIADAQRVLLTDPWREDIVRELVAARYESGDASGALVEYEAFSRRLRDQLDVSPMPETAAVREAILRNAAVPGALTGASVEAGLRATSRLLPFVGRESEIEVMRAAWTRAARGSGGFVLITGEAGVGKTRLAAEAARFAASEGGRVFTGTTAAPEAAPYQAFVEALRSALPLVLAHPPEPNRRAVLARILVELAEPDAAPVALPELPAAAETRRLFDALAGCLRRLAVARPLLLILEDLHWAGSATIDALGVTLRELARSPVLFIATAREEETPRDHPLRALMRSLAVGERATELPLDRLEKSDVAALVARVDGLSDRSEETVEALYARSEGNALFLNEAIADSLETPGGAVDSAGSIEAVVAARTARLSDIARTVAEVAAAAGPGCTVELVREVANLPAVQIAAGFDELLDRRLLREAGARARFDYVFTHHLIAEAIYRSTGAAANRRRHARIARILETTRSAGDTPATGQIALQYERAGEIEQAVRWYALAAAQVASVHAYEDAANLASRALAFEIGEETRRELLSVREAAYGRLGERDRQRTDLDALERLDGGDPARRFEVVRRRVLLARSLGDSETEGTLIASMQTLAAKLGDAEVAQAQQHEAAHFGLLSRQRDGLAPATAALERYERLGDVGGQLECLYLLVDFTTNVGDLAAAQRYLALLQARATSLADRAVEARALAVTATAALLRQEYRECFDATKAGLALCHSIGDREGEAAARARLAITAAWLGEYDLALREFECAIEAYEHSNTSVGWRRPIRTTRSCSCAWACLARPALRSNAPRPCSRSSTSGAHSWPTRAI